MNWPKVGQRKIDIFTLYSNSIKNVFVTWELILLEYSTRLVNDQPVQF